MCSRLVRGGKWPPRAPGFKLVLRTWTVPDEASDALLSSDVRIAGQQFHYFLIFIFFLENANQQYHELCFCQPGLLWMRYLEAFHRCLRA